MKPGQNISLTRIISSTYFSHFSTTCASAFYYVLIFGLWCFHIIAYISLSVATLFKQFHPLIKLLNVSQYCKKSPRVLMPDKLPGSGYSYRFRYYTIFTLRTALISASLQCFVQKLTVIKLIQLFSIKNLLRRIVYIKFEFSLRTVRCPQYLT